MRRPFAPLARLAREAWLDLRLAYYSAALRQINPLHPDVPEIVLKLNELESAQ
jgi:hypothetical protein